MSTIKTASHTPGPWGYNMRPTGTWEVFSFDESVANDGLILESSGLTLGGKNDARLIAAAPELLSALELIARRLGDLANLASKHSEYTVYLDECSGLQNLADEAIRKAKGE